MQTANRSIKRLMYTANHRISTPPVEEDQHLFKLKLLGYYRPNKTNNISYLHLHTTYNLYFMRDLFCVTVPLPLQRFHWLFPTSIILTADLKVFWNCNCIKYIPAPAPVHMCLGGLPAPALDTALGWFYLNPIDQHQHSLQCTLDNVYCAVYSKECTVYSVQCTVYIVHCTV